MEGHRRHDRDNVVCLHCRMEARVPYRSVDWTAVTLALITATQAVLVALISVRGAINRTMRARRQSHRNRKDAM